MSIKRFGAMVGIKKDSPKLSKIGIVKNINTFKVLFLSDRQAWYNKKIEIRIKSRKTNP